MFSWHLVPVVANIFIDLCDHTKARGRDMLAALDTLKGIYGLLESTDYVLSADQQARFLSLVWEFLVSYRCLRAGSGDTKLLNETPKFHYLWHVAQDAQNSNPRFGWCYPDEDYMRICKETNKKQICINTF